MSDEKIFIIAGEKSGDLHASNLIKGLNQERPNLEIHGLGGPLMQEAGCKLLFNIINISVVGFFEVLKHIREYKRIFYDTISFIKQIKPKVIIFIDYPGFNLRLISKIRKFDKNVKIIYYITPQLWAWHKSRIKIIKKYVDKILVIFPFEEKFYKENGYDNVVFVGHPLLDNKDFYEGFKEKNKKLIGLLPGSRISEIKFHMPIMLEIVSSLQGKGYLFEIAVANEKCALEIESFLTEYKIDNISLNNKAYDVMKKSGIVITSSGTATVETALMSTPMIVIYKVSFLTGLFARFLVNIPYVAMVNIIAQKKVVPEFIQDKIDIKKIVDYVNTILENENKYQEVVNDLRKVREQLGQKGASEKAVEQVLQVLQV